MYNDNEENYMYNILICDDERDIVNALKIYLTNENYTLFEAYDGIEALEIISSNDIHLVLMDIMMPRLDGISAMVEIRKSSNVPIILLTAKSEDCDKILGLNTGADDYITKPFNPIEVTARVHSQLRRYMMLGGGSITEEKNITVGGISVNDDKKEVTVDGNLVSLTPKEYEILKLLISNPDKVYSPKELYRAVWNDIPICSENTVAVHIRHLREKIEINPSEPRYLKVVWGQGYKIESGVK